MLGHCHGEELHSSQCPNFKKPIMIKIHLDTELVKMERTQQFCLRLITNLRKINLTSAGKTDIHLIVQILPFHLIDHHPKHKCR